MQNGEEEEDEEEWAGTLGKFRQMAGRRRGGDLRLMGLLFFSFFFFEGKSDTGQNWPEFSETNRNLTRGGTGGINVPDCMPVRDIRPERNEINNIISFNKKFQFQLSCF